MLNSKALDFFVWITITIPSNTLENASFERVDDETGLPTSWVKAHLVVDSDNDHVDSTDSLDRNKTFFIKGTTDDYKNLYQNVYLGADAREDDTYIYSGWAKADSVPIGSNNAKFRLLARVHYTDGTHKDNGDFSFNDSLENVNWQYASGAFTLSDGTDAEKTPSYLKIYLVYNYQGNRAYFDNLMLTKEAVPSYTYDEDGNLVSVVANAEQNSTYKYAGNKLTEHVDPKGGKYKYTYYDDTNLLKTATTQQGAEYTYTYDDFGNATAVEANANDTLYLKSEITYGYADEDDATYSVTSHDQDGRRIIETSDANTGEVISTKDAKNVTTSYTYDAADDLPLTVTKNGQSVSYTYDRHNKLTTIDHEGTRYYFEYDKFGNRTSSKVGNRILSFDTYSPNNGNLVRTDYGNGHSVSYTYDRFGNYATVSHGNTVVAKNFAESSGLVTRTQDLLTNLEHRVSYDTTGRLISKAVLDLSAAYNTDSWLRSVEYNYDLNNNVTHFAYADRHGSNITEYEYGKDNLLSKTTLDNDKVVTYAYDNLGRMTGKELVLSDTKSLSSAYTYYDSLRDDEVVDGVTKTYTTTKLETETIGDTKYKYVYDAYGNITRIYSVAADNTETLLHLYTYDNSNQLTADMDPVSGTITDYSYDYSGNIVRKKISEWDGNTSSPVRGTALSTVNYDYDDPQWKDLMTSYNGQTITYDAIGNPLSYRDGIQLTWQNVRQLATFKNDDTEVAYTYDVDGLRTSKTLTTGTKTDTVEYIYEGGLLLQMRYNFMTLDFSYDANGSPVGIAYRSTPTSAVQYYYYALNSRGDVIGLYSSTGSIAALYEYDAYGKLLGVKNSSGSDITAKYVIANLNPLRYRGYVYDNETGFYYLQSRYYDPTTCRFVNSDTILDNREVNTLNVFAYCANNPIINMDYNGHLFGTICGGLIGGLIGGIGGAISAAVQGKSVLAGAVTGAAAGAIMGAACGFIADTFGTGAVALAAGAAICGTVAAVGNVTNQYWNYSIEKKSQSNNSSRQSTSSNHSSTTPRSTNGKLASECETFADYVDRKSIVISSLSAAVFAPIGIGANCVVNSAFVGLQTGVVNKTAQVIANFAMGGNVSILQSIIDLF